MKKTSKETFNTLAIPVLFLLAALLCVIINKHINNAYEATRRETKNITVYNAVAESENKGGEQSDSPGALDLESKDEALAAISIRDILPKHDVWFSEAMYGSSDATVCAWIEYVNAGTEAISMDGWTITNGSDSYDFPDLTFHAGEYLILYADGEGHEGHLNFTLTCGDEVVLYDAEGNKVDSFLCIHTDANQSFVRADLPYEALYEAIDTPTPGLENSLSAYLTLHPEADVS